MATVIPFLKRHRTAEPIAAPARHRRDGHFDEHDHWHDAETGPAPVAEATSV